MHRIRGDIYAGNTQTKIDMTVKGEHLTAHFNMNKKDQLFGLQYHVEIHLTTEGKVNVMVTEYMGGLETKEHVNWESE